MIDDRHIIICCVIFFGDVMTLGGGEKIQFYLEFTLAHIIILAIFFIEGKLKKK